MRGIHFKLRTKLIFLTLTAAALPVLAVGLWSVSVATDSLMAGAYAQLEAAAISRKAAVERLFDKFHENAKFTASLPSVYDYFDEFEILGLDPDAGFASSEYQAALKDYDPILKNHAAGFQDLYLVTNHGDIVYSVLRGEDFGKNLKQDPVLNATGLARAYQRALERQQAVFEDFSLYPPAGGAPTAFFARPLEAGRNARGGILVVRIDATRISEIMHNSLGLGDTGEAYLVGPDYRLRSNHRDAGLSLKNSLSAKAEASGENRGLIARALKGASGKDIALDWDNEHRVAVVFIPVEVFEQTWALMAEVHEDEMRAPITYFISHVSGVGIGMFVVVLLLGSAFTYNILRQLGGDPSLILEVARNIAQGNLHTIEEASNPNSVYAAMREMTQSLREIIQASGRTLSRLAQGDLEARIDADTGFVGDFAETRAATNDMAENLQGIILETNAVLRKLAQGERRIEVIGKFPGDFVEIKKALENSIAKLSEATSENDRQNWLKTGQAQLNERLRGEQDIHTLAKNSIDFLVTYLDVQIGLFYVIKEGDDGESYLRVAADYGYRHDDDATSHKFHSGEGLVGQVVLERKPIVRRHTPEESTYVSQSGLARAVLSEVLLLPFLYEDTVKGVIELGSHGTFNELQREFLEQAMPSIGITVNAAESRKRTQSLLKQSQAQSEELQKQKTAMEETNEQLKAQAEELQSQTEELQSQSEELQVQQEELRQTNEVLEQRSHELESQQEEVQKKNAALEKAGETLRIKAEELELASKYKSEFLANMSHELRTPLNSLLILAQLLASNKEGNLTEKQIDCARTIHTSGSDLLVLINEVLDLSKVEAGKLELHAEEVKVDNLTGLVRQKFQHVAEEKKLALEIDVAADFPRQLYTDPQRIKQVIDNLLSNALKFTEQGAVQLRFQRCPADVDLSRSGLKPAQTLVIEVTDSGIGIPHDKRMVIFEAFQQADGTTSRKYGGTGLGLSITRQLVQLMGGEIQLHSEEGKGSRFSVYLPETSAGQVPHIPPPPLPEAASRDNVAATSPIPEESAAEAEAQDEAKEEKFPAMLPDDRDKLETGDKLLLIIEDDEKFARILLDLAHEKNFKCLHAGDGRNGLQLAEHFKPHGIILDIGLPQVDGWTVMEHLKENPESRHIPVHVMSGQDHGGDAKRMGAVGYSLKPVTMEDVSAALKHIGRLISSPLRKPLVLTDNLERQQAIRELLQHENVEPALITTCDEAARQLCSQTFDCLVLDIEVENDQGLAFLEQYQRTEQAGQIPVIVYAERQLTSAEQDCLQRCEESLTVKTVQTPERLLDEATLFLHQVESTLPEEKRRMLRMVHDKESIFKGRKILLVDDDVRNAFALATALQDKKMEILIGKNGKHGLELLEQNPDIDLVLMDIMMPEMDGYEAMRNIREHPRFKRLPIIALTAKAMKNDKAKCIEAGASDYLAKPVDMGKLLSLMRVWLYR